MQRVNRFDVAFLVLLALALIALNELEKLDLLFRMPYVTLMVAYFMGRYVSVLAGRGREVSNHP